MERVIRIAVLLVVVCFVGGLMYGAQGCGHDDNLSLIPDTGAGADGGIDGDGTGEGDCPNCICDCCDDCCDGGDITVTCDCEAEAHAECNCCDCCDKDEGFCGDEILQSPPEQCEVGINPCPDHMVCNEDTCLCELPPFCGDGVVNDDEECEDGVDETNCTEYEVCKKCQCLCEEMSCLNAEALSQGECDLDQEDCCELFDMVCKFDVERADGCCVPTVCGDGAVEGAEECEVDGDCLVQFGEECDDCICVNPLI